MSLFTAATLTATFRGEESEAVNLVGRLVVWETLFAGAKGTTVWGAKVKALCILKGVFGELWG